MVRMVNLINDVAAIDVDILMAYVDTRGLR